MVCEGPQSCGTNSNGGFETSGVTSQSQAQAGDREMACWELPELYITPLAAVLSEEFELGVVVGVEGEVPVAGCVPPDPAVDCSPGGCAVDPPGCPVSSPVGSPVWPIAGVVPPPVCNVIGEPSVWIVACVAGVVTVARVVGVVDCGGYPKV